MAAEPTAAQTVGPYFTVGLVSGPIGPELVEEGRPGALRIEGMVLDGAGDPVPDALVEIWQADEDGTYPAADIRTGGGPTGIRALGRCGCDREGHFHFLTVKPGRVAHPDGGMQAPHLAVSVFARGLLKHLVTRMYFPDEAPANAEDPVLSSVPVERRATLVARRAPGGLVFDIRLQGPDETVFFAL